MRLYAHSPVWLSNYTHREAIHISEHQISYQELQRISSTGWIARVIWYVYYKLEYTKILQNFWLTLEDIGITPLNLFVSLLFTPVMQVNLLVSINLKVLLVLRKSVYLLNLEMFFSLITLWRPTRYNYSRDIFHFQFNLQTKDCGMMIWKLWKSNWNHDQRNISQKSVIIILINQWSTKNTGNYFLKALHNMKKRSNSIHTSNECYILTLDRAINQRCIYVNKRKKITWSNWN